MDVRVVDHPLAKARLTTMRDARTDNAAFRAALRDLTLMLIYEATRDAAQAEFPLHTPVARTPPATRAGPVPPCTRRWRAPPATGWRPRRCWCRCCGPGWAWSTPPRRS